MTSAATPPAFRLSLRELLILFTATILGFVALRFCNRPWLAGVAFVTLLSCIVAAVLALVARGAQQASAIGFITAAGMYLTIIYLLGSEASVLQASRSFRSGMSGMVEVQTGLLPTTLALQALYDRIAKETYSDSLGSTLSTDTGSFSPAQGAGGYVSFVGVYPASKDFIRVGHCLWALLFGYLGAKLAIWIYARRTQAEATPAAAT